VRGGGEVLEVRMVVEGNFVGKLLHIDRGGQGLARADGQRPPGETRELHFIAIV